MPTTTELFDLSDDVAVVTGAGRGIGEGIATTLADAGAAVVCAARRLDEIERVAAEIRSRGGRAIAVATDVTDNDAVDALAATAVDEFGHLDIWINNAGGSPIQAPLTDLDPAEWQATMALNLTAVWVCTNVAARAMRDGGRIVNISSRAAVTTTPGSGHYAAAKAAVNSLTQTYARELGPRIRVNCIRPGAVPTEIMMTALKLSDDDLAGQIRQPFFGPLATAGCVIIIANEAGF
jgi:NAD(P)-dependent dehydrogenase (short-subunit alcohol dehydrogenase family)